MRIGLVGYGKGGRFFHAPLISGAADCELAGVVTRSAGRRGELERAHPGTPAYDDLAQLVAAGVEAVVISTPADTHVPLSLQALSLGLPVVCDKPFALQSAAAREVVEAAERAGLPLTVYQNRRFDADLITVQAVIGSGELGQVNRFESRIEQYAPPDGIPDSGGGILFDLGAHIVDQVLLLFGPVTSVYSELDDAGGVPGGAPGSVPDGGVPGRFFIAAWHAGGVLSHLVGDLLRHGAPGKRFRVFGTRGSYDVGNFDGQAVELMAGGSPAASGQGAVPVDPWDAVAGLEVLEAAQRSASTRQVVALGQG